MAENMGRKLALLRLIPIIILIIVAFGSQHLLGVDKLWATGLGLVAAVILRYALIRIWK